MESLDEFQLLESMIQKSEDNFLMHHNKKHKASALEDGINLNNNPSDQMDLLRTVIVNELNNYPDLKRRDELIVRLCQQLQCALVNQSEVEKSENLIDTDLKEIKQQMRQFSTLVHKYKDSIQCSPNKDVRHSLCQTDQSLGLINLDDSMEIFRRQEAPGVNLSLTGPDNVFKCDSSNGRPSVAVDKMLIEQMKELEEKFQCERQSYLSENDRLNLVIEENHKTIDELKRELKKGKPTNGNNGSILFQTNNGRLPGDFQTNNHLLNVLSVIVKTFFDTENDIQKHLETLGLESNSADISGKSDENGLPGFPSLEEELSEITFDLCDDGPDLTPRSISYPTSQTLTAGGGGGGDIEEDVVLGASRRLRLAVGRVLKILSEIVDRLNKHNLNELLKQKEDLTIELTEEGQRRDKLTQQLLDKERLVHSLEDEKKILVEQLVDYQEVKSQHEHCRLKLDEYEQDRDRFMAEKKRFELEKSSFSKGLPQLEHKLLQENELLNRDIHQLKQDKMCLQKKINSLMSEIETVRSEKDQVIETKNGELEELLTQLNSNEKNLNSLKRFVEEQTQERELEREEFGKELNELKDKLKEKDKVESKQKSTIRSLESQISLLNEEKSSKEEQNKELSSSLKEANMKISDLNLTVRQLERDLDRNNRVEKELRNKMRELSNSLDIKLNDETNWEDLINVIAKFAESKSGGQNGEPIKQINRLQTSDAKYTPPEESNSIFLTIKLMDDKINTLNQNIDDLCEKNEKLEKELLNKNTLMKQLPELESKIKVLEDSLQEKCKSNELLQQEINQNHIKYSELKVKLESSIDLVEFKKAVNDLQSKLTHEKGQYDQVVVRLEQSNRHVSELTEKLDAYKKEIKSFKELLKSAEHEKSLNRNKVDYRGKYESLLTELTELNNKLFNKDKSIGLLEQNVEVLKSKLNSALNEKSIYFEQLHSMTEANDKVVIYEKNVEKLRLQNKICNDKIIYLELEIQNLRKKIEILEKENDYLKMENQKLLKLKHEMNNAIVELDDNVNTVDINTNVNPNLYLNGVEKINSITSSNLLMLKVRRLLTQKGALIYQKNYLINVLSTYQRTENDTLALLDNLCHSKDIDEDVMEMRGKPRFRSVAFALIALSRMKYLVNIWQCRKRQLLLTKSAHSISNNHQKVPVPPKKASPTKLSSNSITSPSRHKHPQSSQINSSLKDFVDRLHVVHGTLGLQTNKL